MYKNEVYDELLSSGAIQHGHFVLSSGLHSEQYIQCAQLFMDPKRTSKIAKKLITKISENIKHNTIDLVVSPALGGMILGYEIAKQLNLNAIFCERINGKFEFRRGFNIDAGMRVLLIEDVVTTAKSSLETIALIKQKKGLVIAEGALIDRSKGLANQNLPCTFISLLQMNFETYDGQNLPQHLVSVPINTPGSRFIKNKRK